MYAAEGRKRSAKRLKRGGAGPGDQFAEANGDNRAIAF